MYKITLFDYNCPSCTSGVYEIYCDDIEEFEKEWTKLETSKSRIERFRKSKAGEMVTDYYSDAPELNIVQKDETAELYYEKTVFMYDKDIEVLNSYYWPSYLHIDKSEFQVRYIKLFGRLLRLVKYKLTGVCQDDWLVGGKTDVTCYGNPILKNHVLFRGRSFDTKDYNKNTIESIAYYPLGEFETEEEMKADYENLREDFFTAEELNVLFSDIPGEAG